MKTKGGIPAAVIACLLAALVFASSADAKLIRYAGETEQGYGVTLKTNAKGRAQYMSVSADTDCRHPAVRRIRQSFEPRFRKADYSGFVDGGHITHHFKKYDTVGKVRAKVTGTRVDRNRLRGTFRWQMRVRHAAVHAGGRGEARRSSTRSATSTTASSSTPAGRARSAGRSTAEAAAP